MKTRRTTLVIEEGLYKQAKRLAVDKDKPFCDIVAEALGVYLAEGAKATVDKPAPKFRSWPLGLKEPFRRADIYEERFDRKFGRRS